MGKKGVFADEAKKLYVKGLTLTEISKRFKVSMRTLGIWKEEFDWEDAKRKHIVSGSGAIEILEEAILQKIENIKTDGIDATTADELTKIIASLEKLKKTKDTLSMIMVGMEHFAEFVNENYKEKSDELIGIIGSFIDFAGKQFGGRVR